MRIWSRFTAESKTGKFSCDFSLFQWKCQYFSSCCDWAWTRTESDSGSWQRWGAWRRVQQVWIRAGISSRVQSTQVSESKSKFMQLQYVQGDKHESVTLKSFQLNLWPLVWWHIKAESVVKDDDWKIIDSVFEQHSWQDHPEPEIKPEPSDSTSP